MRGLASQDNDLQMMEDMAKYLRAEEVPYDGRHSEMKNVIWCGVPPCSPAPLLLYLLRWVSEHLRVSEQVGVECQLGAFSGLQSACILEFPHASLLSLVSASVCAPERVGARMQADTGGLVTSPNWDKVHWRKIEWLIRATDMAPWYLVRAPRAHCMDSFCAQISLLAHACAVVLLPCALLSYVRRVLNFCGACSRSASPPSSFAREWRLVSRVAEQLGPLVWNHKLLYKPFMMPAVSGCCMYMSCDCRAPSTCRPAGAYACA